MCINTYSYIENRYNQTPQLRLPCFFSVFFATKNRFPLGFLPFCFVLRKPEAMGALRQTLLRFCELTPLAFQAAEPAVVECLNSIGRNFRSCEQAPGRGRKPWKAKCIMSQTNTPQFKPSLTMSQPTKHLASANDLWLAGWCAISVYQLRSKDFRFIGV